MAAKENLGGERYTALYIAKAVFIGAAIIAAFAAVFVLMPSVYESVEDETAGIDNTVSDSTAAPLDSGGALEIGGKYTYGRYPRNSDRAEPIVWRLLDTKNGRALLISECLIDARRYDRNIGVWKKSELREWLDGEFLDTAFTAEEREKMLTRSGDLVTLLNVGEAERYFKTDAERMAAPTLYAIKHGASVGDVYRTQDGLYSGWWWLRTTGLNDSMASFVDFSGSIYEGGDSADSVYYGVRPVITVSLLSEDVSPSDG